MSHKAFAFDWDSFAGELLPLLERSLSERDEGALRNFIEANLQHCRDPYEGEPLGSDWQSGLETGDIQELADFALTRYYNPSDAHGLSGLWMTIIAELPAEARAALLGFPIGHETNRFDPGLMGAYFQTPEMVRVSVEMLSGQNTISLTSYCFFLRETAALNFGLFVTF